MTGAGDYTSSKTVTFKIERPDVGISIRHGASPSDYEVFDHSLEWYLDVVPSSTYSPKLAHIAAALSCAAYDKNWAKESFANMGFDSPVQGNYSPMAVRSGYSVAVKDTDYGKLALVVVRGSQDLNWLSNFDFGAPTLVGGFYHHGFEQDADEVLGALRSQLGGSLPKSGVKYFVTGHSQGAAAANIIEEKLSGAGVPKSSVYGYNVACPDSATGAWFGWGADDDHANMFNIGNSQDPVTYVPGRVGDAFRLALGTFWGKFGKSMWFSDENGWDDPQRRWSALSFGAHGQERYLSFLRSEPVVGFKGWWEMQDLSGSIGAKALRLLGVHCPVDVTVKDGAGGVVASVTGGVVDYHASELGRVVIATAGDEKVVAVPADGGYTVELAATGEGDMTFTDSVTGWFSEQPASEKSFAGVTLTTGKRMEAAVGPGGKAAGTRLFVVDQRGETAAEVATDGSETAVAPSAPAAGKAKNPMTAKAKKKSFKVSAKKLKKKAQKVSKPVTVKKAQGKVTYSKASTSKKLKKFKKFKVAKKTGTVTVPKKTKKGTYKLPVTVSAAGNEDYSPASKKVTLKISVK